MAMTTDYTDFDHSDDNEDDDDDDIGALGSILSWDEDDDGVVGTTPVGVNASHADPTSALPDLVSFSHMKDKDGGLSYLQQPLVGSSNGTIDATTANLPVPTPINYQSVISQPLTSQEGQKIDNGNSEEAKQKETSTDTASAQQQQQEQLQQQQQQIRLQQQQIQQQQQQIQQQQIQQQLGIQQQQQRIQQQMVASTPAPPQAQATQQGLGQASGQPQQAQVVTQQNQLQQVAQQAAQQAAAPATMPNIQGAISLLQQNALLAHQNAMVMPSVPQPGVQEKPTDQQQQQTASQYIDPNIIRRLQVAQLQQQFAVQAQAVQAQAQAAALQQRIHYPGQVQMVPSSVPSVPMVATAASVQPKVSTTKKTSRVTTHITPSQTQTEERSRKTIITKSPLVSASDTDGEASLRKSSTSEKKISSRKKNEIDMSNMTPEERQKANRDRNREHARNTRLRKKAYLETLKSTVNELCQERDTLVTERAGAASILVEMNNTRTEVLMSFFALRSANEKRRQLWASILDESCFTCALPVTPYRSFPASEVQVSKCQRTILGIDGMMSDTASLHVLLNTLVDRARFPTAAIAFRYTLVTEEAVVAGNQMMARWVMQTLNATQYGARMEVSKQGMLCCKFNSSHKIVGLELMFDVMALMLQLKQAAGSDTFSVIPNTVQTCQRSFDTPMVMILADEPHTVIQVNKLWEEMSGYKAEEVVGKTSCRVLEGEQTDANAVEVFMDEIRFKRPTSAMILHYKKSGERFKNFFLAYPLSTDSRITHYVIFTSHVGPILDRTDVSSSNAGTSVSERQALTANPPVAVQPRIPQSNLITQNLRANFNAAQRQAASTTTLSTSQPLLPVLSNPLSVAPSASILPPNLASCQNSSNFLPQQLQMNASKRPHESLNSGDNGSTRKQSKTTLAADNTSPVDPSNLVLLSNPQTK